VFSTSCWFLVNEMNIYMLDFYNMKIKINDKQNNMKKGCIGNKSFMVKINSGNGRNYWKTHKKK
jgi:hypothetical protein